MRTKRKRKPKGKNSQQVKAMLAQHVKFSRQGFKHLFDNLKIGLLSGFPPCCIIDFCLDDFMGKPLEKRHIHGLDYRPCRLCYRAHRQTYQRAVTELLLDTGYLENEDYAILPQNIKKLVLYPPNAQVPIFTL
jgi:hypothetical protein